MNKTAFLNGYMGKGAKQSSSEMFGKIASSWTEGLEAGRERIPHVARGATQGLQNWRGKEVIPWAYRTGQDTSNLHRAHEIVHGLDLRKGRDLGGSVREAVGAEWRAGFGSGKKYSMGGAKSPSTIRGVTEGIYQSVRHPWNWGKYNKLISSAPVQTTAKGVRHAGERLGNIQHTIGHQARVTSQQVKDTAPKLLPYLTAAGGAAKSAAASPIAALVAGALVKYFPPAAGGVGSAYVSRRMIEDAGMSPEERGAQGERALERLGEIFTQHDKRTGRDRPETEDTEWLRDRYGPSPERAQKAQEEVDQLYEQADFGR